MKKLITLVLATLIVVTAQAEAKPIDPGICKGVSTVAEAIMKARQHGMSAAEMVGDSRNDELVIMIIRDSYRTPFYISESEKERAVTEFGSKHYLACLSVIE